MAADDEVHDTAADEPASAGPAPGLAAVVLGLAGKGRAPEADDRLDALLESQRRLADDQQRFVSLQIENLEEDRALQHRHLALRYFGDQLRIGLQLLAVAFGLIVVGGLGAMVWQASRDHGLVVEAFSVPPDLAQRGLTGQVVAKQMLDRLTALQTQTESRRAAGTYQNDWGDQLKVEIPQTGVSLGELRTYLLAWLGHETRISGEVYRTPLGISVTARAGEGAASTFTGPDADFDTLIQQAAEGIYRRTQPYRYATYLQEHDRLPEALAIFQGLSHDPDPLERAWAELGAGIIDNELSPDAYRLAGQMRLALATLPGFAPALLNLQAVEADLGHDEEAVRVAGQAMAASESLRRHIAPERRESAVASLRMSTASLIGDYSEEVVQALKLESMPRAASQVTGRDYLPGALARTHDFARAKAAADRLPAEIPDHFGVPGMVALELGDPAAVGLLTQARDVEDRPGGEKALVLRFHTPWLAIAEARFGDPAGAQALISTTPTDCYLCLRARGRIAAGRGDRAEASRWFAQAIRQGPDLPQAYVDRGSARLAWGDVGGTIMDARRAHEISPRNADALKLWGDGLSRQGRWGDAVEKYDAALKYAPAWSALRQARDAAARRTG